ncbi:MAG TPA: efflux RND transporter periplasmic adaptor subunit [Puia sp.]|nr:efflux RND transporter periplasmic adaptor subunit [Puia sp.]
MNYKSFLLLLFTAALFSCSHPAAPPPPPPTAVNVYTVKKGSAQYYNSYPATITSVNEVEVRPQVAGYITGIFFKEGQYVEKGQKLYSIDAQQYRGAYEQAVAQLHATEANLSKLQQDADRYEELGKQDAIAQQTVQHAVADLEAGKKQVDAAKANVSALEVNLRYSTIYAPLSGTIGISQVKIGASVSPGSTLLNTISSDNPIAADVALDETLIPFIEKESRDNKLIADSIFTLTLSDQSRYPYPGTIYIIDRAVDPQTATIKIRLQFPNPTNFLRAGMSANLKVLNNSGAETILIPYRAVIEQMAEYFVFTVNDDSVTQKKIFIGQQIRDMVVVKSGLEENELIVVDGVQKLKNGAKVKVAAPASPGADSTGHPKADSSKRKSS